MSEPVDVAAMLRRLHVPERAPDAATPCGGCGYDLRMQPAAGLCPECGRPVWATLLGDILVVADPRWLRQLRQGQYLAIFSLLIFVALLTVSSESRRPLIHLALLLTMLAAVFAAIWMFSSRAPNAIDCPDRVRVRQCVAIATTCVAVQVLVEFAPIELRRWLGDDAGTVFDMLPIASILAFVGAVWSLSRRFERFMFWADDSFFSLSRVRLFRRGFIVGLAGSVCVGLVVTPLDRLAYVSVVSIPLAVVGLMLTLWLPIAVLQSLTDVERLGRLLSSVSDQDLSLARTSA